MDKEGKLGFFKRLILSIKDFEVYGRYAVEDTKRAVGYALKLLLLFTVIILISVLFKITTIQMSVKEALKTDFPEFTYANTELIVDAEEAIIIENEQEVVQIVIVDTKEENEKLNLEKISLYNYGVGFFKDKIVVNVNGIRVDYTYAQLEQMMQKTEFTKQDFIESLNGTNLAVMFVMVFIIVGIILFIVLIGAKFLDILFMAILGYLLNRIYNIKLRFNNVLNICLYAISLPMLLNMLYVIIYFTTGFTIKYFNIMYTAITSIYVITALFIMKANMIKRDIELQNILDDVNKKQEETIFKKPEEKKEEKDGKEEKEPEEESKEKKKKEKGQGEAKEGGLA